MRKITTYLTFLLILACTFVHPVLTRSADDAALEDNGYETGFQEILVDAGPFPVLLEPGPARLLFQTQQPGMYFLQSKNMDKVPVYMELRTMEGQRITNNEQEGQLLYGVKIKLKAKTLYTVEIHAATIQEMGKTAQIFIASPPKIPPPPPPTAPSASEVITPFSDEAKLMTLVETEPTVANMRRLAALRASRSRDLLRYAEEHQDSAAFDLALHYAQSAGELDPSSTGIKLLQATLYSRAQDLPFAAQLAEGLLLDILSTEPEQDQARQLLAELYFTQAEFGSAIDQFEYLLQHEVPLEGRQLAMLVNAYAAS
jgi:hypothetical protein